MNNTIEIFPDKTQAIKNGKTVGRMRTIGLLKKARIDGSMLLNNQLDGRTEVTTITRYPLRSNVVAIDK